MSFLIVNTVVSEKQGSWYGCLAGSPCVEVLKRKQAVSAFLAPTYILATPPPLRNFYEKPKKCILTGRKACQNRKPWKGATLTLGPLRACCMTAGETGLINRPLSMPEGKPGKWVGQVPPDPPYRPAHRGWGRLCYRAHSEATTGSPPCTLGNAADARSPHALGTWDQLAFQGLLNKGRRVS